MAQKKVDLVSIFQTITQELEQNQQALDQSDDYNHDHGSNMAQTFQTITNALEKKSSASDSKALEYAAKTLSKQANSGSSQLYAQHLSQAAAQFKGKRVNEQSALQLLQTLIGSGQAAGATSTGGGDMLGALLGGGAPATGTASTGGGDLLGSLLGGLSGGGSSSGSQQGGLGLQNLLAAGMAFMQSSQSGQGTMQSLIQAFIAGSGMGNSAHRTQSTELVVNSFLKALSAQASRR
jgi:hypothetical protein